MRNILFPTDFSENANNAMFYALNLAKDMGSVLHIVNSYEMTVAYPGISSSLMNIIQKEEQLLGLREGKD